MEINFLEIMPCRACMIQHAKNEMHFLLKEKIKEQYTNLTNLDLEENDNFPSYICEPCHQLILSFITFRSMCLSSHLFFKEHGFMIKDIKNNSIQSGSLSNEVKQELHVVYEHHETVNNFNNDLTKVDVNPISINEITIKTNLRKKCFTCDICNKIVQKKHQLAAHMIEHDGTNPFSCDICGKEYNKLQSLKIHKKHKHEEQKPERVKCTWAGCTKTYVLKPALVAHINQFHKNKQHKSLDNFECDLCGKMCHKKHHIIAHLRQHMGLQPFHCEECSVNFKTWGSLQLHNKINHSEEAFEKFECNTDGCKRSYNLMQTLKAHQSLVHLGKSNYICDVCGKSAKTSSTFKKHMYTHLGFAAYPHPCSICPKRFSTKYKLNVHTMRHNNIKNFKCHICGLRKATNYELKIHVTLHSDEFKFQCSLCPSKFKTNNNLTRHTRIVHKGYKPYSCTICNLSFSKAETLKHHTMRHTGEKPHSCTICDKRFIQQIALKTHMKTHNR